MEPVILLETALWCKESDYSYICSWIAEGDCVGGGCCGGKVIMRGRQGIGTTLWGRCLDGLPAQSEGGVGNICATNFCGCSGHSAKWLSKSWIVLSRSSSYLSAAEPRVLTPSYRMRP